jgi:hypothetical protein
MNMDMGMWIHQIFTQQPPARVVDQPVTLVGPAQMVQQAKATTAAVHLYLTVGVLVVEAAVALEQLVETQYKTHRVVTRYRLVPVAPVVLDYPLI